MTILTLILEPIPLPGEQEIYNFGRGFPGLHNYEFSIFLQMCRIKEEYFNIYAEIG